MKFDPTFNFTTLSLVALVVVWWIRGIPDRMKVTSDYNGALRADLLKRIGDLEQLLSVERNACEERCKKLQENVDGLQRQFIAYQLAVAQAIPPNARSAEINAMVKSLTKIEEDNGNA